MEKPVLECAARDRSAFEKVKILIDDKEIKLSPEGKVVYDLISDFYVSNPTAGATDCDLLLSAAKRTLINDKHYKYIEEWIISLWSREEIPKDAIIREVQNLRIHRIGIELAKKLGEGEQDAKLARSYLEAIEGAGVSGETEVPEEEYVQVKATDLVKTHFNKDNLIQIYPLSLNAQLDGGAKPGHHILVFAPTEGAKTLVAINMVYGFLKQKLPVLYIGNEDPAADIIMRTMTRMTRMNKYEIEDNPDKADSLLSKMNWELFTFVSMSPGTFPKIRGLIEKYKPKVVILDQLSNLDVDSESGTQAKEEQALEARKLAKSLNVLVVSVTQAADSATGKRSLGRGDVYGSNVGIPSQIDLMIGVGSDEAMDRQNMKTFSLCKNKLSGSHMEVNVIIDPLLSRVIDTVAVEEDNKNRSHNRTPTASPARAVV